MKPKLHIIIGSTRPGRIGPSVAQWFSDYTAEHGKFEPVLVDLASFNLPVFDEPEHPMKQNYHHAHTKAWAASVGSADAFVFVTPEYNYAPPPALVNALNYLSREWNYAPAGFVSYGGISGGLRSVQVAKQIVTTLKMMPIPEGVPMPMVFQNLDENGTLNAPEIYKTSASAMLDELFRWTETLRSLRAERKTPMKAAA
ncbi:NADPH-dependent FMN reductase [Microvirga mediterraneensis]|uniref:NAD(P)H-dependent oxidoreductase n=1 Tax=Microvirga mediterraneensis TaxID=2754695 RepID=A0A838BMM7_9HYPH|nr:NADPH-dependent FMN reductase [Microvirga mediterraneensis]MBA1156082.1 NAD(P)H-dependent oxidoreductase [Microvirga mediterraneensis]